MFLVRSVHIWTVAAAAMKMSLRCELAMSVAVISMGLTCVVGRLEIGACASVFVRAICAI